MAIAWGTVPDWIAACGTVGALGGAVWLLRVELGRRAEEVEDRKRAQAHLVAAWVERSDNHHDDGSDYHVRIVNRSDLPIYEGQVRLEWPGRAGGQHFGIEVLAPGSDISRLFRFASYPYAEHYTYQYQWPSTFPKVSLGFTDASGIAWRKYGDGTLAEGYWPPEEVE
jgi:hypothetical protein